MKWRFWNLCQDSRSMKINWLGFRLGITKIMLNNLGSNSSKQVYQQFLLGNEVQTKKLIMFFQILNY